MAKTIDDLYELYENLYESVLQLASNNVPVVDKVDSTANKVDALTPYTQTKTAYIGDTEITFDEIPYGNLTIFTDKPLNYSYTRDNNRVAITFDELEEVIAITISIS